MPLPAGPYTAASRGALMQAFEASYVAAFTRTPPTTQVEIINVRVSASIASSRRICRQPARWAPGHERDQGHAARLLPEFREFRPTTVYDRYALVGGQAFDGPAIVEERESTLVVGPGGRFEVATSGNMIVTASAAAAAAAAPPPPYPRRRFFDPASPRDRQVLPHARRRRDTQSPASLSAHGCFGCLDVSRQMLCRPVLGDVAGGTLSSGPSSPPTRLTEWQEAQFCTNRRKPVRASADALRAGRGGTITPIEGFTANDSS